MDEPKYKKVFSQWELKQIEKNIDLFDEKESYSGENIKMEFLQPLLSLAIRHLIGFVGGYLVAQGIITPEQNTQFIAGVVAVIVAVVWSMINKYFYKKETETALDLPKGSTFETLREALRGR